MSTLFPNSLFRSCFMRIKRIEHSFISFVGMFSMLVAILAIATLLITLAIGINHYTKTVNEEVSDPDISYQDYKEEKQDVYNQSYEYESPMDSETDIKAAQLEEDEAKLKLDKKFDHFYTQITQNFNAYAKEIGDAPISSFPTLRKDLFSLLITNEDGSFHLMQPLLDFSSSLKEDAGEFKKLAEDDLRKVKWIDALNWFLAQKDEHLNIENRRIEREHNQVRRDKSEASQFMMIAGGAFLVFIFFVLLLVLLKIERNTRVTEQ